MKKNKKILIKKKKKKMLYVKINLEKLKRILILCKTIIETLYNLYQKKLKN
jgi:hypothetical protein